MFRLATQRSQMSEIEKLESQGNELLTVLGFGGLSIEIYRQTIANLVQQARTEIQSSSPLVAQELPYNILAGFVQALQETANKIEAKNNETFDRELKQRKNK